MPRIDAPTVAEHRAARERALLDAAQALLRSDPGRLPTLAEVGRLAGLSRSGVYEYFASREALLAAVVRDSFPRWRRRLDGSMSAADDPHDRVLAFLRGNLELVADGEHALARTLSAVVPPEDLARHSREFHDRILAPLTEALTELGVPDVDTTSELINAVVHAASRRIEQTGDLERAYTAAADLIGAYIRELPGAIGNRSGPATTPA